MAKNRGNEGTDVSACAQMRIESVDAPTHLGSGDQINGTQINGDGATVINGDGATADISHTFNEQGRT
ncbi:hypothetical protein ACH4FX_12240 [Streptomyces sp. NPDC018019]|uniref:hypothetical protein n=1 Tax=Streptomyces sp. NPDC018019 TaxID=3365030 RepID=UPI0037A7BF18